MRAFFLVHKEVNVMLKQKLLWLMLPPLLFTSACWSSNISNNPLATNHDQMMTVLFSNEQSLRDEAEYYDALLELQHAYPDESLPFQIIYSSDKEKVKFFNIEQYPTLVVLYDNDVKLRIEGFHQKEDIIRKLENTLQIQSPVHIIETKNQAE